MLAHPLEATGPGCMKLDGLKAAKYEIQKPSTWRAILILLKFRFDVSRFSRTQNLVLIYACATFILGSGNIHLRMPSDWLLSRQSINYKINNKTVIPSKMS